MVDNNITEEWRAVEGWPDYEISNLGRVRRGSRVRKTPEAKCGGYPVVELWHDNRKKMIAVHILVCTAFCGPKPSPRHEVAHWDGDPKNNVPENLRWATKKENGEDMVRHGHSARGAKHPNDKLTESQIISIRLRLADGEMGKELAVEYGIAASTISKVKLRHRWEWLTSPTIAEGTPNH